MTRPYEVRTHKLVQGAKGLVWSSAEIREGGGAPSRASRRKSGGDVGNGGGK